jgi:putative ABC transport system ATP-binding protein
MSLTAQNNSALATLPSGRAIGLIDLRFAWPGQSSLLEIPSLSLESGCTLFVGGQSGSGKSSLLGLLAGVLQPVQGECWVLGTPLHRLAGPARDALRGAAMGVVFQQFNLLPYLSVIDNVCLPGRLFAARADQATAQAGSLSAQAEALLRQLDIPVALWRAPAHRLSVGQQQRVAVARAFIGAPRLVIADEPTSALDDQNREVFLRLFLGLAHAQKTTLVMVSHDARMAAAFDQQLWLGAAGANA